MQYHLSVAALVAVVTAAPAAAQDTSLAGNYGDVTLEAGFLPDPHIVNVTAGGATEAGSIPGGACVGNISEAPDYKVTYTAGGFPLMFQSFGSGDTTLVINDAQGNWVCDDDSGSGLNAQVVFYDPPSGTYDVWVGSLGADTTPAKLVVSEMVVDQPAG